MCNAGMVNSFHLLPSSAPCHRLMTSPTCFRWRAREDRSADRAHGSRICYPDQREPAPSACLTDCSPPTALHGSMHGLQRARAMCGTCCILPAMRMPRVERHAHPTLRVWGEWGRQSLSVTPGGAVRHVLDLDVWTLATLPWTCRTVPLMRKACQASGAGQRSSAAPQRRTPPERCSITVPESIEVQTTAGAA
jgi:hypothetical protein